MNLLSSRLRRRTQTPVRHTHAGIGNWVCAALLALTASAAPPPTELPELTYTNAFFPGARYTAAVPTAASLLGFEIGERATSAAEIERCLKAWTAAAPDRTKLVEYARTYEGRPLYYVVVTSPANLARLDEIQAGLARLGDPRKTDAAEANKLIESLPAVAWLAYTIHGDETEGSDAALAMLYHLIAAENEAVKQLLERTVVIIDPLMNPDGRDRFIKMIAENRGRMPDVDDQSLVHTGYWPQGRGNHYLFDLNRDWIYGIHPETRGRIREVAKWNPQLFVDAHGMGAQDTHLFSPPRPPINPNLPASREPWLKQFSVEQAQAFDRAGLVYYNGEWNEEWYPGYSDGWAAYRGAVGLLYEQARVAENGVRRADGRILSYRESVRHHVIGNQANLATLGANRKALLRHFYETRQAALAADGPYAQRTFAVPPSANHSRLRDFLGLLQLEGFEVFETKEALTVPTATDQLGREVKDVALPAGTLLIPNRQPLAHLLAAMLEFDPRIPTAVLAEERKELLQKGRSRIYDTTAWNLTMLYGLEALTLPTGLPAGAQLCAPVATPAGGLDRMDGTPVAFVLGGADDLSVAAAARLMERGVKVRVANKEFAFDGVRQARGSVVITALDNRTLGTNLVREVDATARELGLTVRAATSGMGPGDLPDLGGEHFQLLERPRIALVARGNINWTDSGAMWFLLDHRLAIRHAHLGEDAGSDLARYNVILLPQGASDLAKGPALGALKDWVKAGGTLIAVDSAAAPLMAESADFSKVRDLPDALAKLPDYELAVFREWLGRLGIPPTEETVWAYQPTDKVAYPWQAAGGSHPEEKELKKRDAWLRLFTPQGALLSARADTNHWLTFGCGELLPVAAGGQPVLMAAEGVEAPVRYGSLVTTNAALARELVVPADKPKSESRGAATDKEGEKKDGAKEKDKEADKKDASRIGWCALPPGTAMHLRMSGLLWPEAAHRLANSAYVTRESLGRGQIILFANSPAFRGSSRGVERLLLNAIVYGPGLGTLPPIIP